jgi:hypothetical protein
MKPYIMLGCTALGLVGLVGLTAACDREVGGGPLDPEPRAVIGVVETKIGDLSQSYDLRVDRVSSGFLPALRPIGHPGLLAERLGQLPFVADSAASGGPFVIETPAGTVTTIITYRRLGPWQVLDRATTTLGTFNFEVALHDARLER